MRTNGHEGEWYKILPTVRASGTLGWFQGFAEQSGRIDGFVRWRENGAGQRHFKAPKTGDSSKGGGKDSHGNDRSIR